MKPTFEDAIEGMGDIAAYHAERLNGYRVVRRVIELLLNARGRVPVEDVGKHRLVEIQFQRIRQAAEKGNNSDVLALLEKEES